VPPPPPEPAAHVLYIVYWGGLEPLGRALVLPAVTRLAALGPRITLVTFEKPADSARRVEMKRVADSLRVGGVRWLPLRYHKRPKVPATTFDIAHGVARGLGERLRVQPDVVHARTFVGGLIGLPLSRLMRASLIYHNEGFYPDEQVDAGVWRQGSVPHRIGRRLEGRLYRGADAVFSLSWRGKDVIDSLDGVPANQTPVVVVPSCVDLDHFAPRDLAGRRNGPLRLVYVGSIGGRYLVDRVGRFAYVARQESPDTRLELLTPADHDVVRATLASSNLPDDAWSSKFVPHERLPDELSRHDAGLCFHAHGLSAPGGSSTKVGEYWAMGLPVISTPGLADVDDIIGREGVGVVVQDHSDEAYRASLDELRTLLEDPELPHRCRATAQRHYGLDEACRRQLAVYKQLVDDRRRRAGFQAPPPAASPGSTSASQRPGPPAR
jgi:glycosyltransferase involved in cell wall biosynthesis